MHHTAACMLRSLRCAADQPVMPRKLLQRDLQDELRRPPRPTLRPFGFFQAFQITTNIEKHIGQIGPHGVKRPAHALLRCNGLFAQVGCAAGSGTSRRAVARNAVPTGRDAGRETGIKKIPTKPLASLELRTVDQRLPGLVFSTTQPVQRALALIHDGRFSDPFDLDRVQNALLMLLAKLVISRKFPSQKSSSGIREHKPAIVWRN